MKSKKNTRLGFLEGILSIVVNVILFGIKYWAGIVSGSVALLADAWHTLSDSLTSIVVIVGIRLSVKKPDKKHPFGYGRWEQIASIFIGFILGVVASEFIKEAYQRFRIHETAHYGMIAIVVTIVSVVVKEALARFAFGIFKKTALESVKADAWHHRSDALSSVVILGGIFLKKYFWWIDSFLAVIVSLLLFYAVFNIIKSSIANLLGEEPSEELIQKVRDIARRTASMELNLHHFHLHNYGSHKELTFHIHVPDDYEIKKAHRIASRIEAMIYKELDIEATIHAEPVEKIH